MKSQWKLWVAVSVVASVTAGLRAPSAAPGSLAGSQAAEEPPGVMVGIADPLCAQCHGASARADAMRDRSGASVAPFDLWSSTMMANSARDPFWRAAVDAELLASPKAAGAIASKCLSCHAPLADAIGLDDHGTSDPLHALDCEGELGDLAREGVSCTICHGMLPDGLGSEASFTAGFQLDPYRRLFGPHEEPFTGPMRVHTGFEPTYGPHVERSSMCGSCHTLITHPVDAEGEPVRLAASSAEEEAAPEHPGFHEQTPYLEWRNSVFSDENEQGEALDPAPDDARTCQSCHVPRAGADGREIRTNLAHNPGGFDFPFLDARKPFGRHLFVGGNAFMLGVLNENRDELGVRATDEAFEATIAATRDQLGHRTAQVSIAAAPTSEEPGRLAFDVTVQNLSGHKLPTGHPSRRMWLEVTVLDADDSVVFRSGHHDERGRIVDAAGEPLATESSGGPVEPHRSVVRAADEVARYRAVMADVDGAPTHRLMAGAEWYIDDRILPRGWNPDHADAAHTSPAGVGKDADYVSLEGPSDGADRVRYVVPRPGGAEGAERAGDAGAGLRVRARLLYQSVSPRWVSEIQRYDSEAIRRFTRMYEAADAQPEVLATAEKAL